MQNDPLLNAPTMYATHDGSATLYHPTYQQTYHSKHGAITESLHVFLGHAELATRLSSGPVSLLEIGIGTGLNLVLSASLAARNGHTLHYTGIEQSPPPTGALRTLDYAQHDAVSPTLWASCIEAFDQRTPSMPLPHQGSATFWWTAFDDTTLPSDAFDVVYHDGFSADVNPELWSDDALCAISQSLKPGGVVVTYSVQGHLRRTLAACGLHVERLPGPVGGKRQVLRAFRRQ